MFKQLKKNLKKDFSKFQHQKIALLGDSSTQFLAQSIRGIGYEFELNLDLWETGFNQIERQILDLSSELYEYNPDIIIIYHSSHKLLQKFNKTSIEERIFFADKELSNLVSLFQTLKSNISAKIIYYNFTEINDGIFGNFSSQIETSFIYQLRKLNFELSNHSIRNKNIFICDISTIQNKYGKDLFFQPSIYINTEMVLSIEILPHIAKYTVDIINALNGKIKKCVILDLDNTLWGGVIGDDGLENIEIGSLGIGKAFTEFQYWIKSLKNRGIILAVCSKNSELIAKTPFENHPDMILRLDDISVFVANWNNKADNIRHIQKILNIGFDSMVFLDDNPFERNIVRENIPEICVPEIPEDPAEYLDYLYSLNLFETVSFSELDGERTKQYQIESIRAEYQQNFTNEESFLESLKMVSVVEEFNKFNIPRVAQLSQRSNQYNLRTLRYTENDVENLSKSKSHKTFSFTLEDKFGDNGLICVVILAKEDKETLFIENWFMSCRVLKRNMENFVLNSIIDYALNNNFRVLKGEYIPTSKNEMVKLHYQNLGFIFVSNYWTLDIKTHIKKQTYITVK